MTEGIFNFNLAWVSRHSQNLFSPRWRKLENFHTGIILAHSPAGKLILGFAVLAIKQGSPGSLSRRVLISYLPSSQSEVQCEINPSSMLTCYLDKGSILYIHFHSTIFPSVLCLFLSHNNNEWKSASNVFTSKVLVGVPLKAGCLCKKKTLMIIVRKN